MRNTTRDLFDKYIQRQAELNHISAAHITKAYSIDPSVEQKLEDKIQQSSEMLKKLTFTALTIRPVKKSGWVLVARYPVPTIPPRIAVSLPLWRRWIRISTPVTR